VDLVEVTERLGLRRSRGVAFLAAVWCVAIVIFAAPGSAQTASVPQPESPTAAAQTRTWELGIAYSALFVDRKIPWNAADGHDHAFTGWYPFGLVAVGERRFGRYFGLAVELNNGYTSDPVDGGARLFQTYWGWYFQFVGVARLRLGFLDDRAGFALSVGIGLTYFWYDCETGWTTYQFDTTEFLARAAARFRVSLTPHLDLWVESGAGSSFEGQILVPVTAGVSYVI
jgi:hypothetical protein